MGVPVVYASERGRPLKSYNALDIASGRGLVILYAGTTTANFFLSNTIFNSNDIKTMHPQGATASNTTIAKQFDVDFDIEFETPAIMDGQAICNLTLGGNSGAVGNKESYAIVKARHVDNATVPNETDLDSEQSDTLTWATTDDTTQSMMVALALDITNQKFKIGEKFRLTVEIWSKTSANDYRSGFGHDPANRNDPDTSSLKIINDSDDTQIKIQLPFKVDL